MELEVQANASQSHVYCAVKSLTSRIKSTVCKHVLTCPLEPILHPSPRRIQWFGIFTLFGHPIYALIWGHWIVQPYESVWLRGLLSLFGLTLLIPAITGRPTSAATNLVFVTVFWLQLPVFFTWMYLANGGNGIWLASCGAMILIWYHVTDWRIATVGLPLGAIAAYVAFHALGMSAPTLTAREAYANAVVIAFCWSMSILMGALSANARQIQRDHVQKALKGLAGSIAHEMRNPLGQVRFYLESLENAHFGSPVDDSEPQRKLADVARLIAQGKDAIRRGLEIIDMTMNEVGEKPIDTERFITLSAFEVAQKAVSEFRFRSEGDRHRVTVAAVKDFMFKGNETLFIYVLFNLLKNASYYFDQYPQSTISIEVGSNTVVVRDTGPGIPKKQLESLFDAFQTQGKAGGTGLGLAYCRRVIHAFGGKISCNSLEGRFTEFRIRLPAVPKQEPGPTNFHPGSPDSLIRGFSLAEHWLLANKTILIVDDESINRRIVRTYLARFKLTVIEAASGSAALKCLETAPNLYDLVLMDMNMPNLGGLETARIIRAADADYKSTPIIALTANDSPEMVLEALAAGINDLLKKPFDLDAFKLALSKVFDMNLIDTTSD